MIYSVNFYQNFKENIIVFTVDNDPGSVYKVVDGVRTPISYTYNNQTLTTRFEQVGEFDVILTGEPKITHFENDFVSDDSGGDTSSDFGTPVLCNYGTTDTDHNTKYIFLPIFDHSDVKASLYDSEKKKVIFATNLDSSISNFFLDYHGYGEDGEDFDSVNYGLNLKGPGISQPERFLDFESTRYGSDGIFERLAYPEVYRENLRDFLLEKDEYGNTWEPIRNGKYFVKLSNISRPPGNDIINRINDDILYTQEYYFEIVIRYVPEPEPTLDELKQQYIVAINGLAKLSAEEKQGFIDRINVSTKKEEMESIYTEALLLNNNSSGGTDDPLLETYKQQYIVAINGLAKLSAEEKQGFIGRINDATTQQELPYIYLDAYYLNDSKQ